MTEIAQESASERNDGAVSLIASLAIIILILSYCVNAMDRALFPLLLTDVRREYGINLQQAGLLSTIFTLGMAVAGLPTGYLTARYSRKTVMQIGILIYSVGTIVTATAIGFGDMLFYRAITGIGEAMQLTALLAIFAGYFTRYKAAALGCLNIAYALGAAIAPALGTSLLVAYGSWRVPMFVFGAIGLGVMVVVAVVLRPWLSEAAGQDVSGTSAAVGGTPTLRNSNTIILTCLSIAFGLALYGYLGMYPTFLREELHYAPPDIGRVMSSYGLGVLVSIFTGWLGDRFSARIVLPTAFVAGAAICTALFNGPTGVMQQATLSCLLGMIFSGTLFVNIAGYSVKSVSGALAGRASGIFITALYGSATVAGYIIGWVASLAGWTMAGNIQLVGLCLFAAVLSLFLNPALMAARTK
jgi:DHA1 family inner membrane transport protein